MDEVFLLSENIPTKVKFTAKFAKYSMNQRQHAEPYPQITSLNISIDYLESEFSEKGMESDHVLHASLRLTRRKQILDTTVEKLIADQKISRDNILLRPHMSGNYVGVQSGGTYRGPIPRIRTTDRPSMSRRQMGNLIPIGIQLNHFLPNRLLSYYNLREVETRNAIDQFLRSIRERARQRNL